MNPETHWQQLAIAALIEEVYAHQLALTEMVVNYKGVKGDASKVVESWIEANQALVRPAEQLLDELWVSEVNDLSMIAVASRQFRAITEGYGS